jgi:hypothetical protein
MSSSQIFGRLSPPTKGEPSDGNDPRSTCSSKFKNDVLGYEDLTQKQQEHAITLP